MLSKKLLPIAKQESPTYIEDVFSTYLYTGNGSTQTINNGIDLASKGGLVWIKDRTDFYNNILFNTNSGATKFLLSDTTDFQQTESTSLTSFGATGFSLGSYAYSNTNGDKYVSWTFRKAKKFFDVVTYTGNGSNRTVSHNLGSVPGMIVVKNTNSGDWQVYHNSIPNTNYLVLNTTAAKATGTTRWNSTTPTASVFSLGTSSTVNESGKVYVAYLFAHDTTTDGLIQCGSFSGTNKVNLGWEPQFLMVKRTDSTGNWFMLDTMRKLDAVDANPLYANLTNAEASGWGYQIDSTGFQQNSTGSYIYMAIRRGPMRTPTDGTKVFSPYTGSDFVAITTGFPVDCVFDAKRTGNANNTVVGSRIANSQLKTASTGMEVTNLFNAGVFQNNTGINDIGAFGAGTAVWSFRRAPSFFDVVCYTGTGVARTVNHNLGVAPELMIIKKRSASSTTGWLVWTSSIANTEKLYLNLTNAKATDTTAWDSTSPTSTTFTVGTNTDCNNSTDTYIAWLFSSCTGVSKVGSYTGTGATQTISCGFTGGARFVLIKRTSSTGNWHVWDTARGMVSGTDPRLALNLTSAETNANWVYTATGGFQIVTTDASVNANGGSYIYFAVA